MRRRHTESPSRERGTSAARPINQLHLQLGSGRFSVVDLSGGQSRGILDPFAVPVREGAADV
jgi:hypothetical protein